MTAAPLAVVLVCALMALAVVLNHSHARLALVELALNEGLPPGYQSPATAGLGQATTVDPVVASAARTAELLDPGVHVFLSRNCHACQRLVDEFDQTPVQVHADLHLHYVDRPRPIAVSAASKAGATLHGQHADLAQNLGADPLPYTVAVGAHGLVAHAVTPTIAQVSVAARDAGIAMDTVTNS